MAPSRDQRNQKNFSAPDHRWKTFSGDPNDLYGTLTTMSSTKSGSHTSDLADRIRDSAREDIRLFGILGLRVTRVAKRAHCSVTQIYRHFEDRDGLLAEVLAQIFEEIATSNIESTLAALTSKSSLTIEDVVDILPMPSKVTEREESLLRSQILAVATVNPDLRDRLAAIAQRIYPRWVEACEIVEGRLPPGQSFDRRVVFIVLMNSNLLYNSLLDDKGVTDDEYRNFMIEVFSLRNAFTEQP